jgi:hypothetical protein
LLALADPLLGIIGVIEKIEVVFAHPPERVNEACKDAGGIGAAAETENAEAIAFADGYAIAVERPVLVVFDNGSSGILNVLIQSPSRRQAPDFDRFAVGIGPGIGRAEGADAGIVVDDLRVGAFKDAEQSQDIGAIR